MAPDRTATKYGQNPTSRPLPNIGDGANRNELTQEVQTSPGVGRLVARPSSVHALRVAIGSAPELQERLERTTSPR